ncbi:hypothetical protein [Micromonospora sp. CPCC 206061]|uniref:hypothetical protein n=1 Tax=Micromonospora sp. CPCC 206061 TaxID=3122410 RepID=UPI002FF241F8
MRPTTTKPAAPARVIDFRYAPKRSWTLIGRPLDHHKSLVREDGALLYGFHQAQFEAWTFDRVIALRAQTDDDPVHVVQRVESPRRAIVHTVVEYPRQTLELTAFADLDSAGRRRDIVLWQIDAHPATGDLLTGLHIDIHDRVAVVAPPGIAPAHRVVAFAPGAEPALPFWPDDTTVDDDPDTLPTVLTSRPHPLLRAHTTGFVPASGLATPAAVLRGGERLSGVVVVPCEDGADGEVDEATARAALDRSRQDWDQQELFWHPVHVPDPAVMDVLTGCARNLLQAAEEVDGLPVLQVGPAVYRGMWVADGHFILEAARYLGWDHFADAGIDVLLKRVKADGSITALQVAPHVKETAIAVMTLVRQHELRGDDHALRRLWPIVRRACQHLAELHRSAEDLPDGHPLAGLMPIAFADGGVAGQRAELTTTVWTLAGLRSAATAGDRLALDGAAEIRALYDRMRDRFVERARQLRTTTGEGTPYLPMFPPPAGTHHFLPDIPDAAVTRAHRIQPESATWALCQAIWPGEILPPDASIVRDLLGLLDARDDAEGIPLTTGWLPFRAVWSYSASFAAHAWLYAGRGDKAVDYLYAMANHATAAYVWREEHSETGTGHGQICGDMPHNWASAEFIRLVRHLLLMEVGETVRVLPGVPAEWTRPGDRLQASRTPTRFGPVDLDGVVDDDGSLHLDLDIPAAGRAPTAVTLHLPAPFAAIRVDGAPAARDDTGGIALPTSGRIRVTAKRQS